MKKAIGIIAIALIATSAFAQGGSWYVGGLFGFNVQNENFGKNMSTTSWSFSPEVGTFFNANWSAGIAFTMNGSSSKNDDGDIMSSSVFGPDIYGRRWFNAGEKLNLFVGLDVAFGSGKTTNYKSGPNNEDVVSESSNFGTNLNAGLAYALAERWTLLLKLSTLGYSSNTVDDNTTTNFGWLADGNITSNQFVFIGVYWTFLEGNK